MPAASSATQVRLVLRFTDIACSRFGTCCWDLGLHDHEVARSCSCHLIGSGWDRSGPWVRRAQCAVSLPHGSTGYPGQCSPQGPQKQGCTTHREGQIKAVPTQARQSVYYFVTIFRRCARDRETCSANKGQYCVCATTRHPALGLNRYRRAEGLSITHLSGQPVRARSTKAPVVVQFCRT